MSLVIPTPAPEWSRRQAERIAAQSCFLGKCGAEGSSGKPCVMRAGRQLVYTRLSQEKDLEQAVRQVAGERGGT
jgi:hypothetical protein